MAPGRTSSAAPAIRSARSKVPKLSPRVARVAKWRTSPSLPLEGFAVLNDTPVACQTRGPTDPQGDRWHGEAVTGEVSPRPGASVSFVSDGPISSNSGRNGGKNAGRNCVSALSQRAIPGSDLLRILADIAFHHRCRSKGLCLRSPARRLTRPLASATAGVFLSYRRTPISLPLEGSVLLSGAPPKAFPLRGPRY